MKQHRFGTHTPEELRRRSNLRHILVLLAAAAELILYREPEGAFEAAGGHGEHR